MDKPNFFKTGRVLLAFERIMVAAMRRFPIRLLAYCLMPIIGTWFSGYNVKKVASPFLYRNSERRRNESA